MDTDMDEYEGNMIHRQVNANRDASFFYEIARRPPGDGKARNACNPILGISMDPVYPWRCCCKSSNAHRPAR